MECTRRGKMDNIRFYGMGLLILTCLSTIIAIIGNDTFIVFIGRLVFTIILGMGVYMVVFGDKNEK